MLQPSVQITNHYLKSRLVAALFVFVGVLSNGCRHSCPTVPYEAAQTEWREGDLVLRCGYGIESRAVTRQSKSVYSHIGVLHYDSVSAEWQVVHAVPAENEPEYVKVEAVSTFFSPERAQRGGWLRVDCNDTIAREAARYALDKVSARVLFDNDYSLADTTQLYCTELAWRAYRAQGIDIAGGRRQPAPVFFCKEGEGIFPNDIERSETTLFVKHFN